jgi:N-acetylmuramoyl-L-alanine amidase
MAKHTVRQGDCISSIADKYGFFPDTLWNLPENGELKQRRQDPNVLFSGDEVFVPDKREKTESCATEQRHRFRRKGTPAILRLRIMRPAEPEEEQPEETVDENPLVEYPPDEEPLEVEEEDLPPPEDEAEEPWADAPYILNVDGAVTDGQTDGDGKIEVPIPPAAREGQLTMEPGTERERVYVLRLGYLDPVTSVSGVADRLNNLGFHDGSRPTEMNPGLQEALRAFQKANDLEESGEIDQATRDKLRELHGS